MVRTLIGCGPQNLPTSVADFPDNGKKLLELILYHTLTKDKVSHEIIKTRVKNLKRSLFRSFIVLKNGITWPRLSFLLIVINEL